MKSLIILLLFIFILKAYAQDEIIPIEVGNVWNFTGLYINDRINYQHHISKIQIVEKDTVISDISWYKVLNVDIRDTISTRSYQYWYTDSIRFYVTHYPEFEFGIAILYYDSLITKDSLIWEAVNRYDWIIVSDSIIFNLYRNVQKRKHYEVAWGHSVYWTWYIITAKDFGPIAYSDERGDLPDRWILDSLHIAGAKIGDEHFGRPSPPIGASFQSNGELIMSWNKNVEDNIQKYRIYSGEYRNDLLLIDSTNNSLDTSIIISNFDSSNRYFRITAVNDSNIESDYSVRMNAHKDTVNSILYRYERHSKYKLYQNYPNPFNSGTKISFEIPKSSVVNINLYDVTGKLVSVIVKKNFIKGLHSINFERGVLASGIYFLQMKVARFNRVRKLLIIN